MNQFSKTRDTTSMNSNTATGGNAGRQLSAAFSVMNDNPWFLQSSNWIQKNSAKILYNADFLPNIQLNEDKSMKNTINGLDKSSTEYTSKFHPVKYLLSSFYSERYIKIDVVTLFMESAVEVMKEKLKM